PGTSYWGANKIKLLQGAQALQVSQALISDFCSVDPEYAQLFQGTDGLERFVSNERPSEIQMSQLFQFDYEARRVVRDFQILKREPLKILECCQAFYPLISDLRPMKYQVSKVRQFAQNFGRLVCDSCPRQTQPLELLEAPKGTHAC